MNESIIDIQDARIFQDKNLILSDVSFTVNKGEFLYLIGKTGSGKSSLLKTLYADIPLKDGKVAVAGFELNKIKRSKIPYLRRKLGVVFQDFQLLSDRTVDENLMFVLKATGWNDKKKMKERISIVLEWVGLKTKGFKMPHELSGGEQQRVAIARALLNDPELIVADEPTGNLDPETSEDILKILQNQTEKGRAVLMASHDKNLMEKFPCRTLLCMEGKVLEVNI